MHWHSFADFFAMGRQRPECAVGLLEAGVREGDGGVSADAGTGLLVGGESTAPSEPVEPPVAPA